MKVKVKHSKKGHGNSQMIKEGLELYKKKELVSKEEIYITEKMGKEVIIYFFIFMILKNFQIFWILII